MTQLTTLVLALLLAQGGSAESRPVILDFHASWCAPCRQMRPAVQRLIDKKYPVKSLDVDEHPDLAKRYEITGVPTFVIVDGKGRELSRISGVQPASDLAAMYHDAFRQIAQADPDDPSTGATTELASNSEAAVDDEDNDESPQPTLTSDVPKPWETVVRIKIIGAGAVGFGSGTVIHSTPEESIILTCAHIFHIERARQQPSPSQFPRKIQVDLFDGKLHGLKPAMVHPVESVAGQAVDYDFQADVGLIRIRPGRVLPSSPVVPIEWEPRQGLAMTTVGCSEGNNATAWSTAITNGKFQGLVGNRRYEAIECDHAPKQGRSGGGLYTVEGYVAGVCNFAEPRGGHGLYASPESIYRMLDKNQLTLCYNPAAGSSGALLANRRAGSAVPDSSQMTKVRAQDTPIPGMPMPSPEQIGIHLGSADSKSTRVVSQRPRLSEELDGWQAAGGSKAPMVADAGGYSSTPAEGALALGTAEDDREDSEALTTHLSMNPRVSGGLETIGDDPPADPSSDSADSTNQPSAGGWRTARRSGQ